jgi:hypothetical protein
MEFFNRDKTLEELEGLSFAESEFASSLIEKAQRLYGQPLSVFTVEDLRLMIGQGLGLRFLIPLAVEELERNPLVGGDYHPGDLLLAVLRVRNDFWKEHQELYWRVSELASDLPASLEEIKACIEGFQAQSP